MLLFCLWRKQMSCLKFMVKVSPSFEYWIYPSHRTCINCLGYMYMYLWLYDNTYHCTLSITNSCFNVLWTDCLWLMENWCGTKPRAVVSRPNNDVEHRDCITKEKLDYYAKSYRGKITVMQCLWFNYCLPSPNLKLIFDIGLWRTLDTSYNK